MANEKVSVEDLIKMPSWYEEPVPIDKEKRASNLNIGKHIGDRTPTIRMSVYNQIIPRNSVNAESLVQLKDFFLNAYVELANVTRTCEALGMVRRTFYSWMEHDKDFKAKFERADKMALGKLEDEAHRRAVDGTPKPVFQGGRQVGTITEYSDTLMIVLLKARAPQKYKERNSTELTGADGKPLVSDLKIMHVHSAVPLAGDEKEILMDGLDAKYLETPQTEEEDE